MSVTDVYQAVIDDVINKVASEFENESVPEHVLLELKDLWKQKLWSSSVVPMAHAMLYPGLDARRQPGVQMPARYIGNNMPGNNYIDVSWQSADNSKLPQSDGPSDDFDSGLLDPTGSPTLPLSDIDPISGVEEDDEEEPLGSDLDDEVEEPETSDIVLCQFEKVTRVKTKHKCQLKDGIMHLNGRDYLFNKATADFEFYYN